MKKKKIAVVDLLATFPPKGGACVDLLMTFSRLGNDFDVKIFTADWGREMERASFPEKMPLPYKICRPQKDSREEIIRSITEEIDKWRPDLVFIGDGWTMKPHLAAELNRRYPSIMRFYAYEMLCPRNNERWLFDRQCESHALLDCNGCVKCASDYAAIVREKKNGASNPLIEEAETARINDGGYEKILKDSLQCAALITYNSLTAKIIRQHTKAPVHVIPGGVDTEIFRPPHRKKISGEFRIAVCGRMDDSAKGAASAVEAGKILDARGIRFRMSITRRKSPSAFPWLDECGWLSRDEMIGMLAESDCALMPSLWQEAFGMSWLEAMAMELPLISSAVAGPVEYMRDGYNALLYPPGNSEALADHIITVKENPELAEKLSARGLELAGKLSWDNAASMTREVINNALQP